MLPGLTVQAIGATSGSCRVDAGAGGICDFADLPAFASVAVTVTYRAAEGSWVLDPAVSVSTSGDVASHNNTVSAHVETHGTTDLELRVDTAMTGSRSATLAFPLITVVNGVDKAFGARLDVTLPSQVTLVSVSASNATCSGTGILRCDFTELGAGASATVALTVRANANGNFVSALRLSASNDMNPANDSRDVAVQISGAAVASASAPGGGGGGRIEFWMLGLLAALAVRRHRVRNFVTE
jgi:hypothetical protein